MGHTKHGGKRKGAGRPSGGRTAIVQLRLTPEQKAALVAKAKAAGQTVTAYLIDAARLGL